MYIKNQSINKKNINVNKVNKKQTYQHDFQQ